MRIICVVVLSAAVVGNLRPARACDSAFFREIRQSSASELFVRQDLLDRLDRADDKLLRGKPALAYAVAVAVLNDKGFQRAPLLKKARAHRIAAQAAVAMGKNADAVDHFSIAVEALPELAADLARAQLALGHAFDARNQLERRAYARSLDGSGWTLLAELRLQAGNQEDAKDAVAEALARNPTNDKALQLQSRLASPTALAVSTINPGR